MINFEQMLKNDKMKYSQSGMFKRPFAFVYQT